MENAFTRFTPICKKENLLANITCDQSIAGLTLYRKFFRKNNNSTYIWHNTLTYIPKQPEFSAVSIALGTAIDTDGTSVGLNWYGKRIVAGAIVDAENGDIPHIGDALSTGDVIADANLPIWIRYQCAAGSTGVRLTSFIISTMGETL